MWPGQIAPAIFSMSIKPCETRQTVGSGDGLLPPDVHQRYFRPAAIMSPKVWSSVIMSLINMNCAQTNSGLNRRSPAGRVCGFKSLITFTAFIVLSAGTGSVRAESLGINFQGNVAASVTNSAGVLPLTNWNNIANTTFTSGTIHSGDGQGLFTLTMSGSGRANGWNNGSTADGANGSLLEGYVDAGSNLGSVTNRISGFAGSSYSVFIYAAGDVSRPSSAGDLLPNYTINGTRYYAAVLGGAFSGFSVSLPDEQQYEPISAHADLW